MNTRRSLEELWTATAEAARESKVIRYRPDPSPCPGDTFVFRETADHPVEWVIIERDPEDVRRLLVVPLDDYPQIGSHDVELRFDEPGRVAHIRCDLGTWLEVSRFEVELRTGELLPEDLALIRNKREAIAAGRRVLSLLEEKVDGDPEYRQWKDESLRALSALESGSAKLDVPTTKRRARPWASAGRIYAIAASVVLAMGTLWSLHQADEMAKLRDQVITKVEENHPVFSLRDGRTRGQYTVRIPEGKSRVTLVVEVIEAEPYERYRLEIVDKHDGDVLVWSSDQMTITNGSDLTLSVPSSLFDSGEYELRLFGIAADGRVVRLEEGYLLEVLKDRP